MPHQRKDQRRRPKKMPRYNDVETFHAALRSSDRILALCGAGLSASSGLPTFRGAGGYWRNSTTQALAKPGAFRIDPGLVWLFYGYRRHMCLRAEPNDGHRALSALAKSSAADFLCLTQNVDNLSQRSGHPPEKLLQFHGSLFDIKCSKVDCEWIQRDNFDDPFCEVLRPASIDMPNNEPNPLLDPYHRIKHIEEEELPKCPQCKEGLQRPGVVWFGEVPNRDAIKKADAFLEKGVDMMLVVGTSAEVEPAASYISKARDRGARIVVVNPEADQKKQLDQLGPGDFAFAQDAATALPALLRPLIGTKQEDGNYTL